MAQNRFKMRIAEYIYTGFTQALASNKMKAPYYHE
jgi:hypothetical protein